jgi:thiol-disulfide isomerase/thioredoxin
MYKMIRELKKADLILSGDKILIKGSTKPGILLVWASWCGHCSRFKPVYNELDQKLNGGFTVLALEDTQIENASISNALGVQGFPTIKFVDGSGRITADYNGDRSMPDLLDHICKFYHHCVAR